MSNSLSSSATDALLSSPPIQHLARRRTEPVGLVNSLKIQPRAVQTPEAIIQRSKLVKQLQTRYGAHTTEAAESELVLANPLASEVPSETFSKVANSIAAIEKEGRGQRIEGRWQQDPPVQSTSSVTPSPEGRFRVSRKAIPKMSQMEAATAIQAKLETHASVNSSIPITNQMPLSVTVSIELEPSVKHLAASHVPPVDRQPLVQKKAASESPTKLSQSSIPTFSKAELIQRSPANKSPANISLSTASSTAGFTSVNHQLPVVSELPLSSSQIQRTSDEYVAEVGSQLRNLSQGNRYESIHKIEADYLHTNPPSRENTSVALPLNTNSVRQNISEVVPTVTTEQPLSTVTASPIMTSMQPQLSIPEVDVAQVAEQVSRILFRQLRIESERRGFRR